MPFLVKLDVSTFVRSSRGVGILRAYGLKVWVEGMHASRMSCSRASNRKVYRFVVGGGKWVGFARCELFSCFFSRFMRCFCAWSVRNGVTDVFRGVCFLDLPLYEIVWYDMICTNHITPDTLFMFGPDTCLFVTITEGGRQAGMNECMRWLRGRRMMLCRRSFTVRYV